MCVRDVLVYVREVCIGVYTSLDKPSLRITSHNPSDASTKNSSSGAISFSKISGSHVT